MNHDEIVKDEFDLKLSRLFAEKNEALPNHEFMQQMLLRMQRENRIRWIRRACVTTVLIVVLAAITPWVVESTMTALSLVGQVKRLPDLAISIGMLLVTAMLYKRARRWT